MMWIVISLGICGMMPSSSAIALEYMARKVNESRCVCWGGCWSVGGVSESDVRGGSDDFLGSLGMWLFGVGPLRFSVAVNGLILIGCAVVAVALVNVTSKISSVTFAKVAEREKTRVGVVICWFVSGVSAGRGTIQMEIFRLGNIEVITWVFFLKDGMNNLLCLEDLFGNLARILLVFNEEKIQEQMGGHVVSICKED